MLLEGLKNIFDNVAHISFSRWVNVIFFFIWTYSLVLGLYLISSREGRFLRLCGKGKRFTRRGRRISERDIEYILSNVERTLGNRQGDILAIVIYFLLSGILFLAAMLSGIKENSLEALFEYGIILILFIYIIGIVLSVSLVLRREKIIRCGEVVKNSIRKGHCIEN